MKLLKLLLYIILFIFLTAITQIGGLVLIVSLLIEKRIKNHFRYKKVAVFLVVYLIATFIIVPLTAPIFGREKIKETNLVKANTFFTKLMNRNYVKPALNVSLSEISARLNKKYPNTKLVYLDANFPFIDKFPLLPHISHNNGKKIDISLIYEDNNGVVTNKKPSISGYGAYEGPRKGEHNQIAVCKNRGKWQYDFPKYLTFGSINKNIKFSEKATKQLVLEIVKQKNVSMLLIEPHLKTRMGLTNSKIRYHGCHAVRHDDHIHFQIN